MDIVWTIFYVGAILLAVTRWLWRRWKTRGNHHWPMAEGTVESHRLEKGRHNSTWYVVYSYSVNGEYYSGEFAAQYGGTVTAFKSQDALEDIVKQLFPCGTKFPLRYKPEEPELSVPFSRQPMAAPLIVGC